MNSCSPLLIACLIIISALQISAQTWESLANVPEKLSFPVVTVLNGKIHVMGGGGSGGASSAHYQYDPATNTWKSLAPVPYKAQQPAGTANAGKIHYFGGGYPNSGSPVDKHYIYNPETDSWSEAAKLTKARAIHYAVSVENQLYSLAGQGVANWCQVYKSDSNKWVSKRNLPDEKFWYGAHIAANGKIYRFGGGGYTAPVNAAHEYDPETDTWSALPNLPQAIHGISGAAIGDLIYLVGGYYNFDEHTEVIIYNTKTQEYSQGIPLPVGRDYHSVVAIGGCLYSIGGSNAVDKTIDVSLIRLCVGAGTSPVEQPQPYSFTAHYEDGSVIVQTPKECHGNTLHIQVYDMKGQLVKEEQFQTNSDEKVRVECAQLPSSVYYVRLNAGNRSYGTTVLLYH